MTATTLRFTALDTLFFRESRPFEAIGGSELASLFPPPPRTVAGAIRTAIGDSLDADWYAFHRDHTGYTVGGFKLFDLIGYNDDLGRLRIKGVWLSTKGERLYPAPLYLLRKDDELARLMIDNAEQTSLGRVRLPRIPKGREGFKPLEKVWLTQAGLEKTLAGGVPGLDDIRGTDELYAEEPRLGIARNNRLRTVKKGLLYQSRHVRPQKKAKLSIEADIIGLEGLPINKRVVRLGGEGRMAGIEIVESPPFPLPPTPGSNIHGLILTLLAPARFSGNTWLPDNFSSTEIDGTQVWTGKINDILLTIHCAVIGKALREGGWDMAAHAPRPVQSLIPPGSAWFCTVDDNGLDRAITALHNQQVGEDQKLGRGRIACGLWNFETLTTNNKGE